MGREQQEKGLAAAKARLIATQGLVADALQEVSGSVRSGNSIPVHLVAIEDRLRSADDVQVTALMESIRDVGILNPITVHARPVMHRNVFVPGYGLIAGLHRLVAAKRLGLEEVPAHVVTLTELERQIAECDENLCGPKLTTSERALFTRRRKEAYEALHPETRQGVAGGKARQGSATAKLSFAADTAKRTGQSERSVQRDAARAEELGDDLLQRTKGTSLDNGAALDALADLPKPERQAVVARAAAGERVTAGEVERLKKKLLKAAEEAADNNSRLLFAQDVARTAEEQRDKAQNEALFLREDKKRLQRELADVIAGGLPAALAAYDALAADERLAFHEQRPDPTEPFEPPASLRVKIPQQSA